MTEDQVCSYCGADYYSHRKECHFAVDVVRRTYLATPEGRQQLKQMIEEAEKEQPTTFTEHVDVVIRAFSAFEAAKLRHVKHRDPEWKTAHDAYWDARAALTAAAQREYGRVGKKDIMIFAKRDGQMVDLYDTIPGTVNVKRIAALDSDKVPAILYALSTLEKET